MGEEKSKFKSISLSSYNLTLPEKNYTKQQESVRRRQ